MSDGERVGKPRPFLRGFLLTVVTLGIYGLYWNYQAHDEVFKQFDLGAKGEDMGTLFLVIGLVFAPLIWVYQYKFVENVNRVREDLGLGEGVSSMEFLLWVTVGSLILVGPIVAYYKLQGSINEVWDAHEVSLEGGGAGEELEEPAGPPTV